VKEVITSEGEIMSVPELVQKDSVPTQAQDWEDVLKEFGAYSEKLREALRSIDNSPNRTCACWVIAQGALTLPRPGEEK
jgi:hypothetical protein